MGLFGIFKKKELPPEEAYKKAFEDIFSHSYLDEKSIAALEKACEAYPAGWQGYLVLALVHLLGIHTAFDEEKGLAYVEAAKRAGKIAGDDGPEEFEGWLEEDCGNLFAEHSRQLSYLRKIGCTMLTQYGIGGHVLTRGFAQNDDELWRLLMSSNSAAQQKQPFFYYIGFWKTSDPQTVNDLYGLMRKKRDELLAITGDDVTGETVDTWLYVLGFGLSLGAKSPFARLKGKPGMRLDDTEIEGFVLMWRAALIGCQPAIHMLASLIAGGKRLKKISYAFSFVDPQRREEESAALDILLGMLDMCVDKGDTWALPLRDELSEIENEYRQQ